MIRRPRRTLPATLVALILLAAAVLVTVSCVQVLLGQSPLLPFTDMAAFGATLAGASPVVLAAAAVLASLGVVLLYAALIPGAPTVLPLDAGTSGLDTGVTRASLASALTDTARGVDGVDAARVQVRGRRVTATVHTPLAEPDELREQVTTALDDRLTDLAPTRTPQVRVRVRVTTRSTR